MRRSTITLLSACALSLGCGEEPTSSSAEGGVEENGGVGAGGSDVGAGEGGAGGGELGGAAPDGEVAQCRLLSSEGSSTTNGMTTDTSSLCEWAGDVQTCEATSEGYSSSSVTTFDCSGDWCKVLSIETSVTVNGMTTMSTSSCAWEGNTQTCETDNPSARSVSEHNERGVVTSSEVEGEGFTSQSMMTYDCSGSWCKQLTVSTNTTVNGTVIETNLTCTWEGNTQTCESSDGSYRSVSEYNEQGAMTSTEIEGEGYSTRNVMSYDCGL